MGTPIPDPIEPPDSGTGNPCSICWGVGKPFGDVDTPTTVLIRVSGVNKGPNWTAANGEPVNGDFNCEQVPGFPCTWQAVGVGFNVVYSYSGGITSATVVNEKGNGVFAGQNLSPCELSLGNQLTSIFELGTVEVVLGEIG